MAPERLEVEIAKAADAIRKMLPAGTEMPPNAIVHAVKAAHPGLSNDVIRGAIWSVLNGGEAEATPRGTIRRLTKDE